MRLIFPTREKNGHLDNKGARLSEAEFYTVINLRNSLIQKVEVLKKPQNTLRLKDNMLNNILNLDSDVLIVSGIDEEFPWKLINKGFSVYYDNESKNLNDSIDKFLLGKLKLLKARP
jgi:predicted Fe-Mo cluster-binding NifX family protein